MDIPTLRLLVRAIRLLIRAVLAQAGGYPDKARTLAYQADRTLSQTEVKEETPCNTSASAAPGAADSRST